MSELRVINISSASDIAGVLWLHGYDRLLHNLNADTVQYGIVSAVNPATTPPSNAQWLTPTIADQRDVSVPTGEVRIGVLVGNGGRGSGDGFVPGDFHAWLKIHDNPEVEPFYCGKFRLV